MTIYRLVITAELERLDPHGATDWRGSHNIATVADLDSLVALVQGDEIAVAVRNLAYRIVSEEKDAT